MSAKAQNPAPAEPAPDATACPTAIEMIFNGWAWIMLALCVRRIPAEE